MKPTRLYMFLTAVAICALAPAAMRGGTLFSDLGPAGNVYGAGNYGVMGSGADIFHPGQTPLSDTVANLFTASGTGSLPVTGIDLAVRNMGGPSTFYASIWTDSGGDPGVQVAGAYWSLSTSTSEPGCCELVSITGITGVTLTGGQQYFMVLGPLSITDNSWNGCNWNNQSVTGLILGSSDGGSSWNLFGANSTLGGFDVTSNGSAPEPATWPMLLALAGAGLWWRRRKRAVA